jgi:hypothetical protein
VPGQLVAAERSQRVERGAVNLDPAGPKPPGDRLGSLLGGRVDAAREAVLRVVGDRNRIVLGVVGLDHEHGTEDLLLGDHHLGPHVAEDSGPDVVPGVRATFFTLAAATSLTRRPARVEPVNDTMSTPSARRSPRRPPGRNR